MEAAGAATLGTDALYLAYRHRKTPWYAKVFAALIVGYVFSPIDPIPDFIPGVGLLDEMVVVPIGVWIAAKMVPRDVMEECQERARAVAHGENRQSRGRSWSSQCGCCVSRLPFPGCKSPRLVAGLISSHALLWPRSELKR